MEAIGRRWTLLGWIRFFTVGLPGPAAPEFQAVGYCCMRARRAIKL